MYARPPLTSSVSLAAIAGTANSVFIAAPGAGFAIRLVGGHVGCSRAAGTALDLLLVCGTFTMRLGSFHQAGGTSSSPLVIPEPGVLMPTNTGVTFTVISTAATGSGTCTAYYFVDTV